MNELRRLRHMLYCGGDTGPRACTWSPEVLRNGFIRRWRATRCGTILGAACACGLKHKAGHCDGGR